MTISFGFIVDLIAGNSVTSARLINVYSSSFLFVAFYLRSLLSSFFSHFYVALLHPFPLPYRFFSSFNVLNVHHQRKVIAVIK